MTFAPTHTMLDAVTAAVVSSTIFPQRRQDEVGKVQFEITGGTATIKVQGRAHPSAPWATLMTVTEADMGDNDTLYAVIELTVEMQVDLVNEVGATVSVWITE